MGTRPVSAHVAVLLESKPAVEFGRDVTLWRVLCSCGIRRCWYASEKNAIDSQEAHEKAHEREA